MELIAGHQDFKVASVKDRNHRVIFFGNFILIEWKDGPETLFTTYPSGHHFHNPIKFTSAGEVLAHNDLHASWLTKPLIQSYLNGTVQCSTFEVRVNSECKSENLVLINCLDTCYGHAFYKLLNAQLAHEFHPNKKLTVIIHPALLSLVPGYVHEVILVNCAFNQQDSWISGLDNYLLEYGKKHQKIFLWDAIMNYDLNKVRVQDFVKLPPFDYKKEHPDTFFLTYILRDDRYWLRSKLNQFLFLLAVKYRLLKKFKSYFGWQQARNFNKTTTYLRKILPGDLHLTLTGLGKAGNPECEVDFRQNYDEYINDEQKRCDIYKKTHISIGILGSHMLLPSYLSAGFISLVPDFKIFNYGEDYIPKQETLHRGILMSRFLDDSISPKKLALHISGMLFRLNKGDKIGNEALKQWIASKDFEKVLHI